MFHGGVIAAEALVCEVSGVIYKNEGGEFNNSKLIRINDRMAIILEYAIPLYKMRYKIDEHHEAFIGNKYRIATLGIIKHPEDGYKVVSFMWDK